MHVGFPQFIKWKCGNRMCAAFFLLSEDNVADGSDKLTGRESQHDLFVSRHYYHLPSLEGKPTIDQYANCTLNINKRQENFYLILSSLKR